MNCLLCNFVSSSTAEIHKHFVLYDRINPDNYFFLEVFKDENGWLCKECIRCNEFLITKKQLAKHNFLKHYADGNEKPVELKPVDSSKKRDITIYQISFAKHSQEYDFFDAKKTVDEFLFNVKNLFVPDKTVLFKADFAIENIQSAPLGVSDTVDIKSLRYWSTDVYKSVYLNDYIFVMLKSDILKRVINNRLSGSSWHFNRFSYLNLKVVGESDSIYSS